MPEAEWTVTVDSDVNRRIRDRLLEDATQSLALRRPAFSARRSFTTWQAAVLAAAVLGIAGSWIAWPGPTEQAAVAVMAGGFVLSVFARVLLAALGRRPQGTPAEAPPADCELPAYTVLVPLYREANMLPDLMRALRALDYPREKLQVILVVEEDDVETCFAAREQRDQFDVVAVPAGRPRTKPKACNYALHFARGEYVVIYDAEDRPETDQLRKAATRFRSEPADVACLQARLAIHNGRDGWLPAMFALDYAIWFKALLPGLERLEVPIPLGGTSNHFRTSVLREAGAWDPFNVTEDADLGMRLARLGHRVRMLDSTTFEESPVHLGAWLRQRSRWMKGFMQTLLVHTRHPLLLVRDVGLRGTLAMHGFLGGAVWSALINPLLWFIFVLSCLHPADSTASVELFARIAGLGLLLANLALAGLVLSDQQRARGAAVLFYGIGFIGYWALITLAAYRGLWHLLVRPHHWDKTPHGTTREAPCGSAS